MATLIARGSTLWVPTVEVCRSVLDTLRQLRRRSGTKRRKVEIYLNLDTSTLGKLGRRGQRCNSRQSDWCRVRWRCDGGHQICSDLRQSQTGGRFLARLMVRIAVTKEKIFLWASADRIVGLSAPSRGMPSNRGRLHAVVVAIGRLPAGDPTRGFALIVARWLRIVHGSDDLQVAVGARTGPARADVRPTF